MLVVFDDLENFINVNLLHSQNILNYFCYFQTLFLEQKGKYLLLSKSSYLYHNKHA